MPTRQLARALVCLVTLLLASSTALAEQPGFMLITRRSGVIDGGSAKQRPGAIEVLAFTQDTNQPVDQNGTPIGRLRSLPLHVLKPIDGTSAVLQTLLTSGETLPTVQITLFAPDGSSYQATLGNARIVGIRTELGHVVADSTANLPVGEDITLTYQTLSWQLTSAGK